MSTLLVRVPNPVGDVVAVTSLLQLLRRQGGDSLRLVAAGRAAAEAILSGSPILDGFVLLPGRGGSLARLRAEARALRSVHANRILIVPNSWSAAAAAFLARIPERVGRPGQGRRMFLTRLLPPVGEARPMTEIYAEFAEGPATPPLPRVACSAADRAEAARILRELAGHGLRPPFVAAAPGAAFGPSKIYPAERCGAALGELARRSGLPALVFGSPQEQPLLEAVATAAQGRVVPAPLGPFKALLSCCRLLLTMDNGARHLAAALGVPRVVLMGPTHPRWSDFANAGAVILRRAELSCIACHEHRCPTDHACMLEIPVEEVVEAGAALLREVPEPSPVAEG